MFEEKYMVIGRYVSGVNVLGYVLRRNSDGETQLFSRSEVEVMAFKKQIGNMSAQRYKGRIVIKGTDCRLSDLPNYDSNGNIISSEIKSGDKNEAIYITARVLDGKNITGYMVSLICNGVPVGNKSISRDKVIELAKMGHIANARVQMSGSNYVLRGHNCKLAKLPIYRAKPVMTPQAKQMTKVLQQVVKGA